MFNYKTFNNIAEDGLDILRNKKFKEVSEKPDGILLRSYNISNKDFEDNLLCIARAGAGTNNIPIEDATKKGIVVFNTPGANANAVKELVICGMLLSSRGIIEGIEFAKKLDFEDAESLNKAMEAQKKAFAGNELAGKTLGIIGLGSIGSMLAQAAHTLGMRLVGYDPYISIEGAWRLPADVEKAETMEPKQRILLGCDWWDMILTFQSKGRGGFLQTLRRLRPWKLFCSSQTMFLCMFHLLRTQKILSTSQT